MTARRLLAASLAGTAVLALSGCQKPAPIVTVVSGTSSTWKEADVYCFAGAAADLNTCSRRDTKIPHLTVKPGERVGVDVGKAVAKGWLVELSQPGGQQQPQQSGVQVDTHYFSFTAPDAAVRLTVRQVDPKNPQAQAGQWSFDLAPKNAAPAPAPAAG
jgi:hypothetical protein